MDAMSKSQTGFGNTAGSLGSMPSSSLKGKLAALEEEIKRICNEINLHKKEVEDLRTEKAALEQILQMKTQDVRKTITNEVVRVEEEMKKNFSQQKSENARLQQQIMQLKTEKTELQQTLLALQRRIAELELIVGSEDIH